MSVHQVVRNVRRVKARPAAAKAAAISCALVGVGAGQSRGPGTRL